MGQRIKRAVLTPTISIYMAQSWASALIILWTQVQALAPGAQKGTPRSGFSYK